MSERSFPPHDTVAAAKAPARRLIDSNLIGVVIADFTGRVIEANDAFLATVGYTREDLAAGRVMWTAMTPPEHDGADLAALDQIRRQGRAGPWEKEYIRKDGKRVPVLIGAVHLEDTPDTAICFVLDLSERRRAEEALRENHRRLQDILNSMFVFVGVFTVEGRVLEVNDVPLAAAGLTRADVLGRPLADFDMWSYSAAVRARLAEAIDRAGRGEMVRYNDVLRAANGALLTLDITFSPLRNAAGEIDAIVGSGVDITAQQESERAMQHAHDRLAALSSRLLEIQENERRHIARELHDEIGQALTAAKINLQAISRFPDPERLDSRLRDALEVLDRALVQVRSMSLELSPPLLEDFGLPTALRWLVDRTRAAGFESLQLSLRMDDQRFDPGIELAAFRVAQEALRNVIRHADADSAHVELSCSGAHLDLVVRDDGVGFDVAAARADAFRGRSLGLASMEERVRLAGGSLDLRSSDSGTEVRASFPTAARRPVG